jgi:hypothetical protein
MELVKIPSVSQSTNSRSDLREEAALRRAIRTVKRTCGSEHPNVALAHLKLGDYFAHEHQHVEAEIAYRSAADIYEALGMGHELLLAIALRSLSQSVCAQDRHDEGNVITARANILIVNYQ